MAQLSVQVNGKPYTVGCEDGQEARLKELVAIFDNHVKEVAQNVGPVGETRLMLMGALLLADDLADARSRLANAERDIARVQSDYSRAEGRAVAALDTAARRIEKLATE